jgi:hypothetical protein
MASQIERSRNRLITMTSNTLGKKLSTVISQVKVLIDKALDTDFACNIIKSVTYMSAIELKPYYSAQKAGQSHKLPKL